MQTRFISMASVLHPQCTVSRESFDNGYVVVFTASHRNSLQHLQQDTWPVRSSQRQVTYHYATCCAPHSFYTDRAFGSFNILTSYSFEAYSKRKNPHQDKDLPVEKSGSMFLSCWNKWPLLLVLYVGKRYSLYIFIYCWNLMHTWRVLLHFLSSLITTLVNSWS